MNFRLRHFGLALKEIQVAALIRLPDVFGEHRSVTTWIFWRWRRPGRLAARHLGIADVQMNEALVDVDLDLVTGLHESERTADEALRRDMEDAGAVACPAHAAVGDADHVAHALAKQTLGDRQHAPLR